MREQERKQRGDRQIGTMTFCLVLLAAACWTGCSPRAGGGRTEVLSRGPSAAHMDSVYHHNNVGIALMDQHTYGEGGAAFEKAIRLYPEYVDGHINLGISHYSQGLYDEAKEPLTKAVALDPDNPYAHYMLGLIYKIEGQYELAEQELSAVLTVDSEDPFVYYNLGAVYSKLGHSEEAIEAYRKVLELNPDNISAHYNLGNELLRLGQKEESAEEFRIFRKLRKDSPLSPSMGFGYLEQGKYAEAVGARAGKDGVWTEEIDAIPVRFRDVTAETGLPTRTDDAPVNPLEGLADVSGPAVMWVGSAGLFLDHDLDGDLDIYLVQCGAPNRLYRNDGETFTDVTARAGVGDAGFGMTAIHGDYDNDNDPDLYITNYGRNTLYRNNGDGTFEDVTDEAGVGEIGFGASAAFADVDHDGDLDIYVANYADLSSLSEYVKHTHPDRFPRDIPGQPNTLYRNNGDGTFEDITERAGVDGDARPTLAMVFCDFDNDRDVDFYLVNDAQPNVLYTNNRDGTFSDIASSAGVADAGVGGAVAAGDYNKDGYIDLYLVNRSRATLYRNEGDSDTFSKALTMKGGTMSTAAALFDADNDGYLDLFRARGRNRILLRGRSAGAFEERSLEIDRAKDQSYSSRNLASGDYDDDGDIDLLLMDNHGTPTLLRNDGGNANHWLKVDLLGLGSNNDGVGCKVEVKAGVMWQKMELRGNAQDGGCVHFGVRGKRKVDMVRVLWPSGVRQTEIDVDVDQTILVTELDRKGTSCPIVYGWDGERFRFLTDILGGAIIGYPLDDYRTYFVPDTDEYIKIDGDALRPKDGFYELQFCDQLEEIAYLDRAELLAVDHPTGVEIYPNEYLPAGPPYPEFRVHGLSHVRPPVGAWDGEGNDVLDAVLHRDRRYPGGFHRLHHRIFGYADEHVVELDLGDLPGGEDAVLVAYGWAEYAHSTNNVAAAQMGLTLTSPYLQVVGEDGTWHTALPDIGFPAGLPKTMTADLTGIFPTDDRRIRIVTNMVVYWDQFLVGARAGDVPLRITRADPSYAHLHWFGYPRTLFPGGEKPEAYDYHDRSDVATWGRLIGGYTRYGDVREPVLDIDDRYVIMGSGEQITLRFDATAFPELEEGWVRDFLFYANGFGKDMDFSSAHSTTVGPLPFHAMSGYPYPSTESYPVDPEHIEYILEYNTRPVLAIGD